MEELMTEMKGRPFDRYFLCIMQLVRLNAKKAIHWLKFWV